MNDRPSKPEKRSDDSPTSGLWRASGMGAEFTAGIVGMLALGWLVDEGLDTKPWGMIIGAAMGIVGGGYNFFRQAQKMNRDASEAFRRDHADRPRTSRDDAADKPSRGGDQPEP